MLDQRGRRKYLTSAERERFLHAAAKRNGDIHAFCLIMLQTGCRISEALNLRGERVDLNECCIFFESLKKRKKGVYRRVPISDQACEILSSTFTRGDLGGMIPADEPLWKWSRMTGYRYIRSVMEDAKIQGPQATPKGLRHGFAVAALQSGVPMNLVQRWLGHSHWRTTAIYADLMGAEERAFAERLWRHDQGSQAAGPIPIYSNGNCRPDVLQDITKHGYSYGHPFEEHLTRSYGYR